MDVQRITSVYNGPNYILSAHFYLHYYLQPISHFSLFFFPSLSDLGVMKEELNSVNMKESLSKLTDHSSSKLASQASSILAILGDNS